MKKLILIDGNNLMYRAYFATAYSGNLMKTSTGLYTNAIYGFVNMIEKIISDDFSHILVAFDAGKTTFRHQDYKEYKDGRKPTPSEFKVQIPIIKEYLDVRGIKRLEIDNFEADDIIGTAKTMYETEFDQIDIYSNDKDLLQLISDNTTMKSSKKGLVDAENYTPEYLKEKMGITPELITDLKGLMGDASDNLKGIPGVGEKTAIKLLNKYGNLEAIIDASDTITGKLGERIREHYEEAILCKKIATIFKEVDLGFGLKEMQYDDNNDDQLIDFYKRLEFHSLIKKRMKKDIEPKFSVNTDFTIMQSEVEINRILIDETSLHLETFGDNYHKTKPLGFALSNSLGNFFIPYDLIHTSISLQLFLSDESNNKSVFDLKKVKVVLRWDNYDIKGVTFDLLLAAYTLNPSLTKEDYKIIASAFDYDLVDYEETIYGKGVKKAIPEMETYAFHAVTET